MKRSDFKKGQTVYLMTVPLSRAARFYGADKIVEGSVKSAGASYITVTIDKWQTVKFSSETFLDTNDRGESYTLHLTREDAENASRLRKKRNRLLAECTGFMWVKDLPDDKVEQIYSILFETTNIDRIIYDSTATSLFARMLTHIGTSSWKRIACTDELYSTSIVLLFNQRNISRNINMSWTFSYAGNCLLYICYAMMLFNMTFIFIRELFKTI